jgi:hypothetical protein
MAVQETISRPAPFVEKLGTNLAENVLAQQGVPVVSSGVGTLSKLPGETDDQFAARTSAAQQFDVRKQSLAGLAPTVAGQDALQTTAQNIAQQAAGVGTAQEGLGSFAPFLQRAQTQANLASGLGAVSLGQLGTAGQTLSTGLGTVAGGLGTLGTAGQQLTGAGTTLGGVPLGAQAFQQDVQNFMSPYQSQVIDASLAEFDRNKAIQEQSIRDQQAALGALGSGRAGVQLAEFGTGAARERALLQAGLLQQGFNQAQGARQQDIQNRFGLGQAQAGLAAQRGALGQAQAGLGAQQAGIGGQQAGIAQATQGLGQFQSGLAGQQIGLGQAEQGVLGTNIARLGQLGALNQAQSQAVADAQREATRQATFLPQEQLDRYTAQVTGIMGGYPGQTQTTNIPNPTPLQTALGVGSTLAGIYGAIAKPGSLKSIPGFN